MADSTGRLIKIYDPITMTCLHSFKRGIKSSTISNLCFNFSNDCLAASSSTGTIHLYPFANLASGNSEVICKKSQLLSGFNILTDIKSYLPEALSLPKSLMKLHLQNKLECNCGAEGSLVGPMTVFDSKNKLVFSSFIS